MYRRPGHGVAADHPGSSRWGVFITVTDNQVEAGGHESVPLQARVYLMGSHPARTVLTADVQGQSKVRPIHTRHVPDCTDFCFRT